MKRLYLEMEHIAINAQIYKRINKTPSRQGCRYSRYQSCGEYYSQGVILGVLPGVHKVLDEFSHYFCSIILTNNTLLIAYIN